MFVSQREKASNQETMEKKRGTEWQHHDVDNEHGAKHFHGKDSLLYKSSVGKPLLEPALSKHIGKT